MDTPKMITDLAVMLLTAGMITILFKKIRQPLILGYILTGFLIGPYFPMFFSVEDTASIDLWSEIGVIILMFHIGLEFNLHKLAQLGETAVISTIVKMGGVMLTGYFLGILMGLSSLSSIFLGGMLSISSTAVIQKSFEELGVKKEKYSQLVMGTLVIEDIVSIFMMVVLSTVSVSQNIEGPQLVISLLFMLCYLIVWLILGIFLLPTFLNKVIDLMNDEMLTVLSLGLCFGMVLIANMLGFSSELGAFLAGSLLAGTIHVERVEHITKGIKDMFVAVFFLSVGMMVDPQVILEFAPTIVIITLVAVAAKLIFATLGMLLSGQTLRTALKSGFSLAPIGEFSFILAALGVQLKVMESHLYPIIVIAAVITTFLTPFLIQKSEGISCWIEGRLPEKIVKKLSSEDQTDTNTDSDWNAYMRRWLSRITIYGVIMLVAVSFGINLLYPLLGNLEFLSPAAAKILCCIVVFFVMAIFTRPMLDLHNSLFTALWLRKKANRIPLIVLSSVKVILIAAIASLLLMSLYHIKFHWMFLFIVVAVLLAARSNFISASYLQLETRFLRNLNERIIEQENKNGHSQAWLDEELQIISWIAPQDADFIGKSLKDLQWGKLFNVYIVKIRHNGKHLILPNAKTTISAGDKVFTIGSPKAIENFYRLINIQPSRHPRTLKEFMGTDYPDANNALSFCAVKLSGNEPFSGKTLRNSHIKDKWHCVALGMQQQGYPIIMPNPNVVLGAGDILWVMGSNNHVGRLVSECMEDEEKV